MKELLFFNCLCAWHSAGLSGNNFKSHICKNVKNVSKIEMSGSFNKDPQGDLTFDLTF
jgi:hypothetical protein